MVCKWIVTPRQRFDIEMLLAGGFAPLNGFLTQKDYEGVMFDMRLENGQLWPIPITLDVNAARQKWDAYFLVDPLDGTKEFIKKNGEFTINIALMKKNEPYLGVIFAPALDLLYFAEKNKGAFKIKQNEKLKLPSSQSIHQTVRAVVSRSHLCSGTANFLEVLKREGKIIEKVSIGSALKFGLVAEGLADIYPRFTPSMEWDTAAGDLLVTEVGKAIFRVTDGLPARKF